MTTNIHTTANRGNDGVSSPVPEDHPLMIHWKAWQKSQEFNNTISWAGKNNLSSLWAAFAAGFAAGNGGT